MDFKKAPDYAGLHSGYGGVMGKWLIWLGLVLVLIGICWPVVRKLGIGSLPGDIFIRKGGFTFYFPVVTCLVISLILTVIFWLFNR